MKVIEHPSDKGLIKLAVVDDPGQTLGCSKCVFEAHMNCYSDLTGERQHDVTGSCSEDEVYFKIIPDKKILDVCCGSRMMWFDKQNPDVLYMDIRCETLEAKDKDKIRTIEVKPDIIGDFTNIPFADESFYMVAFDPPHLKSLGKTSWMAKKYGILPRSWENLIQEGFNECMRVLKPHGTLIFKWSETEISVKELLKIIPYKPLFGHTTGRQSKTIWISFMKNK